MSKAQCFHCKEPVEVQDPVLVRTSNQRLRLSGKCSVCGKSVSQFVADPDRPQLSPEQKKEREEKRREERKKKLSLTESPKKTISKKRALKVCAKCACVAHLELIEDQPKKKRRVSKKEKLEKENEKLKEEIKFLKGEGTQIEQEVVPEEEMAEESSSSSSE